jgi:hypothetical protein
MPWVTRLQACHYGGPSSRPVQSMRVLWSIKWHWHRLVFLGVLRFSAVSITPPGLHPHHGGVGVENRPVAGRSSETYSHPIDMDNMNNNFYPLVFVC